MTCIIHISHFFGDFYSLLNLMDLMTNETLKQCVNLFISSQVIFILCITFNTDWIQERGNEPLYVLSRSLKGWPLITPEWNATDFDWVDLMARLRLYNNDILLAQWVGPDIKNSADYIIQVSIRTVIPLISQGRHLEFFLPLSLTKPVWDFQPETTTCNPSMLFTWMHIETT